MTIYHSEESELAIYEGRLYRLDEQLRLWPLHITYSGRDYVRVEDEEGNYQRIEREPITNFVERVL